MAKVMFQSAQMHGACGLTPLNPELPIHANAWRVRRAGCRCTLSARALPVDGLSLLLLDRPVGLPSRDSTRQLSLCGPAPKAGAERLRQILTDMKGKMTSPRKQNRVPEESWP